MSEVGVAIRLPSAATAPTREPWWQRLLASRSGAVGAALTGVVLVAALAALAGLVPHDPIVQHPADRLLNPSWTYLLGTDQFGLGPIALRKGLFVVAPAGAEDPQADARYHRGEPSAKVVDALRVRTA